MNKTYTGAGVVMVLVVGAFLLFHAHTNTSGQPIKIGVITALTGDLAYIGESTQLGAKLAQSELKSKNITIDLVFDDAGLDPQMSLSAATKQYEVDHVNAIYSDLNPEAVAITSYLKDKNTLHVYDAAPISPLAISNNAYKTFLDFEKGCRLGAELMKSRGIKTVGVLENNLEFGQLCTKGIRSVYPDAVVEPYSPGTTDFRTMLTKLKNTGAIFNASFVPDQIAVLKGMRQLGLTVPFVGHGDLETAPDLRQDKTLANHAAVFSLPTVSPEFIAKLQAAYPQTQIANINLQAATMAYIHIQQMAEALNACGSDMSCVRGKMDGMPPAPEIGFNGFKDHIAQFNIKMDEYKNGQWVMVGTTTP